MLELVHHFICADMRPQAMETALQAAEVAIARGAPREAERVLTRLLGAYAVAPGSRLRLLLAHSLVAAGPNPPRPGGPAGVVPRPRPPAPPAPRGLAPCGG